MCSIVSNHARLLEFTARLCNQDTNCSHGHRLAAKKNRPSRVWQGDTTIKDSANTEPTEDTELPALLAWLDDFKARHGRPLRVLHVGNIAANGYLNAKFLRRVGVDADIVSRDYYHVMACPEWEDLEIRHDYGSDFNPVFASDDLKGYTRPDWFFSGPLALCAERIAARYKGAHETSETLEALESKAVPAAAATGGEMRDLVAYEKPNRWHSLVERSVEEARKRFGRRASNGLALLLLRPKQLIGKAQAKLLGRPYRAPAHTLVNDLPRDEVAEPADQRDETPAPIWDPYRRADEIVADFDRAFPDREDRMTADEPLAHLSGTPDFTKMFAPYDIVQCYATEPLNGLLAEKQPYIGFEHGTLRHFTLEKDPLSRLTALGYRRAAHTFITNGDCLAYAKAIGVENYSAIIHPIDVPQHRQDFGGAITKMRADIGGDVILFCPVRHDYEIKGTDVFLNALPMIKKRLKRSIKMVLVRWGTQVEESIDMLEKSGCSGDVIWTTPMSRVTMIKYIRAADVVLDQMVLPPFGSTAPQSLSAGTPVISSYRPESTAWMFKEPAPIMSAYCAKDVVDRVEQAVDPIWRAEFKDRARHWVDTYHSTDNVIHSLLSAYKAVLLRQEHCAQRQTVAAGSGGKPTARASSTPDQT